MNKFCGGLFAAGALLALSFQVFSAEMSQPKMNGICLGNSEHPERVNCASVDPDDYYEQYPETAEDFQRNERYQRNHQTYVCRKLSPSYAQGAAVSEYVVTDPRDCR